MVAAGLDVLLARQVNELAGKSVGIVGNHAAVTRDLVHIADALNAADVKIGALFGPEHGARGDVADGQHIDDTVDERLGVPVYSLYGKTRTPSPESLKNIDIMIVDVQDVGARFYTFVYTMAHVMAACGENDVPVWVLDRPNPITGTRPEGPILEPHYSSFIGMYSVPVRHGLTIGELARLFRAEFSVDCELRVIPMDGWTRDMEFEETGLPWVPPSPNMPTVDTAFVYPGTCLIEGTNASEGRGTTRPFEIFGASWVDPGEFRRLLMSYDLPGAAFREAYFTPCISKFAGEPCAGVQLYVTDRGAFRPVLTGVAIICAFYKLYSGQFTFRPPAEHGRRFFDLLTGTASVREAIEAGQSPWDIAAEWEDGIAEFESRVEDVLLY